MPHVPLATLNGLRRGLVEELRRSAPVCCLCAWSRTRPRVPISTMRLFLSETCRSWANVLNQKAASFYRPPRCGAHRASGGKRPGHARPQGDDHPHLHQVRRWPLPARFRAIRPVAARPSHGFWSTMRPAPTPGLPLPAGRLRDGDRLLVECWFSQRTHRPEEKEGVWTRRSPAPFPFFHPPLWPLCPCEK